MFEDGFWPNLAIFVAGQIAAWGYLRTGLIRRGVCLMVGAWILADIALLARFAYEGQQTVYRLALTAMQAYSLCEFVLFAWGRWRRRRPAVRRQREELFRAAFLHYLRDEREAASRLYRAILRRDHWDVDAALGLATVLARSGQLRRARSLFRLARGLDRQGRYASAISWELRRFAARSGRAAEGLRTP